jgi:hypothetical protein
MKMLSVLGGAVAVCLLLGVPAKALTVTDDFSGSLNGNLVSGTLTLDVSGGQALAGTGTFTGFGLTDVPIVLITTSTPGNETSGGPSAPVGFRDNFGTDIFAADTDVPLDSNGLLFDVDTSTAVFGQYPLLAIASGAGNSVFTGTVGGTEYYTQYGTIDVSTTPLPASVYMFATGLILFGLFAYRRNSSSGLGRKAALSKSTVMRNLSRAMV